MARPDGRFENEVYPGRGDISRRLGGGPGRAQPPGKDYTERLLSLDNLGDALFDQSEYAQAELKFREAWEIRKKTVGKARKIHLSLLNR